MTAMEIAVIVGGLAIGYWVVGNMLNRKTESFSNSNREKSTGSSQQDGWNRVRQDDSETISTNWFRILEVSEDASKERIVAAYKTIISQYHPDRVVNMGKEIREVAESKSKKINAAYDYAMKLRR